MFVSTFVKSAVRKFLRWAWWAACHRELGSKRSPAKRARHSASADADAASARSAAQCPSVFRPELCASQSLRFRM